MAGKLLNVPEWRLIVSYDGIRSRILIRSQNKDLVQRAFNQEIVRAKYNMIAMTFFDKNGDPVSSTTWLNPNPIESGPDEQEEMETSQGVPPLTRPKIVPVKGPDLGIIILVVGFVLTVAFLTLE